MKEWVTMHEAAKLLKVSTKTIQRRVKDGTYKSQKNGQTREVLYRDLGIQGENTQSGSANTIDGEQGEFLKEIIRNQQKHIESQDERISEVNKLILGIQGQVTQLNQNLQLVTSKQENSGQKTDYSVKNEDSRDNSNFTPPFVIPADISPPAGGGVRGGGSAGIQSNDSGSQIKSGMTNSSPDKSAWKKYDHFERHQNIYLIITVALALAVVGLILWQTLI